jgi:predicted enzyme related to lactoylglutathione lyase
MPGRETRGIHPRVPCWVDTSQPDPGAAVTFYGGLFDWHFEDVMLPGSEASYAIAGRACATPGKAAPLPSPARSVMRLLICTTLAVAGHRACVSENAEDQSFAAPSRLS